MVLGVMSTIVIAGGIVLLALLGALINRSMRIKSAFTRTLSERASLLEKSQQRYRLIVDTALDAVVTMDQRGLIEDWNVQAEKIFGWTRADAIGQRMSDVIIPAKYRDAHEKGLTHFLRTGEGPVLSRRIEITALRRDGFEFPVELTISPARMESEWTFSAFIRDISERNKSAEALRAEEQRYRDLFEDVPVGLYRSSPDGRLMDVNPAMVSMFGYPDRDALLATPAFDLYVNADDRARWSAAMGKSGFVRDFVARMRRADGAEIWVRESTHAKRDAEGEVVLCEGTLEDITESLDAEQRLQGSERRLTQVMEAMPVGIFVADTEGQLVFGNGAAKRILGRGAVPELSVPDHSEVYHPYVAGTSDPYPADRMPIVRALKGEVASAHDIEVHQKDKVVSLSIHAAPIFDASGEIVGAVTALTDTTERRLLEAQLRQALKMEAIGQLAGGIAHDFNNLLTVILSTGAMLVERMDGSDPHRNEIQEIVSAAERAAGLTRQLLAFSRKQVMQPRVVDVNAAIADIENMLRRLIGEDIELVTALDPIVGTINADPGQVEQVLVNLVVNARDAMPDGGRVIIATALGALPKNAEESESRVPATTCVLISVSDTGIGMSRKTQERLFDPFFTTKGPGQGTGLGLSTVYGIVRQSGGEITVISEPGMGTTLTVYLPQSHPQSPQAATGADVGEVRGGGETVLLVEDDDSVRSLAARVLKRYGYQVLAASNGAEALALAADSQTGIDVVLTDVIMPGMNGREVVERLLELRPGLSYIFMSGYTDDAILKRGILHGESAFLQKPFRASELACKVREVLDRESTKISD